MGFDIDPNKLFERESPPKKVLQWLVVAWNALKMKESFFPGSVDALPKTMTRIARIAKNLRWLWEPLGYRRQMSRRRRVFLAWIEIIGVDVPCAAWFWVLGLLYSVEGVLRSDLSYYQRIGCFIIFGLAMLVHKWFANSAHITLERLENSVQKSAPCPG